MKTWIRPTVLILTAKQLSNSIYACANSNCVRKFVK